MIGRKCIIIAFFLTLMSGLLAGCGKKEYLSPYIKESNQLDLEDIPENILEGLTFGGRMVCLPMTYEISCVGGRSSQIGEMESWTMEDIYRLSEQHPESIGQLMDDGVGRRKQRDWC